MRRKMSISILLGFFILAAGVTTSGTADRPSAAGVQASVKSSQARHAPDRVIVKFKEGAEVNLGLQKIKHLRLINASVFKVPAGETAAALVKRLSLNPTVEYAELDFEQKAVIIPTDTRFSELWGLHNTGQGGGKPDADIDAPEAWDLTTGSSDVVVAVIDTGVDYTHTDLVDNIWTNSGEIPGDHIDNDGNGYIDDVHGINAITGSGDPMDDYSPIYHGTHCSGTIGAKGDNSKGVVGVCWTVKIMCLKFLNSNGSGWNSDAVECIQYAVDKGAHVLSNSWGGGGYSQALRDAIEAAKNAGILFMAAAGNDYGNNNDINPFYPASYNNENIIAVAATDRNDLLAGFSNIGPNSVDVAAPGVSILSCKAGNAYQLLSGTSMATPHVSGLAALLKSYNPSWTWDEIKTRILAGVDPLPGLSGKILTGGRINALNSLLVEPGSLEVTSPNGGEKWARGTTQAITWTSAGSPGANVKIELLKAGAVNRVISSSTANDGSYSWAIPPTQTTGSDYQVRITSTTDTGIKDTSDGNFAIKPGTLTVTVPNGGEQWARGTTHEITWTSAGNPGANVKIELLKAGILVLTISSSTANNGSYSWAIPASQTVGTNYKVRITSTTYPGVKDASDKVFAITI
jgi:subtilisin family serine protease